MTQHTGDFLLKYKTNFVQLTIVDKDAIAIASCDSIFNIKNVKNTPLNQHFPLFEGIFDQIWDATANQGDLRFQKVQKPHLWLPGIYDFTFMKIQIQDTPYLLWSIYDYTDIYSDLQKLQQRRNEFLIHQEKLALQKQ